MPLHDLHRLHRAPYRLAESPVWDDRSGKFLWCDILDGTITEMDEHGAGAVSGRRSFLKLDDTIGRPDGAAMDAEGCYWSCGVSAGRLNRFSPDGELIEFFELPVPAPTMPCFGGADGRTLVLTSLTDGVSAERVAAYPESGSVLVARTEVAGAPITRFLDQG